MTIPRRATYRLQLREGMTLGRAAEEVVPYVAALGASHLYLAPPFTAAPGSTHGYDVADPNEIDPELGGREALERLSEALRAHGMGLVIDIVPNHMAASVANPWWRDVIEWGAAALHARHFDIDWSHPLTLTVIDGAFEGAPVRVEIDAEGRGLVMTTGGEGYPLTPPSYRLLAEVEPALEDLAAIAEAAAPEDAAGFHAAMRGRLSRGRAEIEAALEAASADRALLGRLHEAQPWRLVDWRQARRRLSYRRFFEVTGLVGLRVEDEAVFDDAHRLILELVEKGVVDGLRVDHVDGLRDPAGYLARLRERAGPGAWITVEKILERGEALPPAWPIEGTTGYEVLAACLDLPIPEEGEAALKEAYAALSEAREPEAARAGIKRSIVRHNFEGELGRVAALLAPHVERPASREAIRAGLAELIVAIPVYRTYGDAEGFDAADLALLAEAAANASGEVGGRLMAAIVAALARPGAREARARFQQLTGPAMAKSVEDTLFYRQDALMARNEVGSDPLSPPMTAAEIHAFLAARLDEQPEGLNATATHDTKRGEDARARLAALAEAPDAWVAASARWREMSEGLREGGLPEPRVEWSIHQALAGCWPSEGAPEGEALEALRARFDAYVVKAARESGRRTEWNDVDEGYEGALLAYTGRLLGPEGAAFRADFDASIRPLIEAGRAACLGWAAIKCLAPGVPDIYQGTEWEDLSLVDPDNRRAPDWAALASLPERGAEGEKSRLLRACLNLRARLPELFASGAYESLEATGPRAGEVFAFARVGGAARVVVAVPARPLSMVAGGAGYWEGTALDPGAARRDAVGGAAFGEGAIPLADLLAARPVAVLASEG